jgi:hypothetical protein
MTNTIWGTTTKPASSERLARRFAQLDLDGTLYIGYPVIGTPEGPFTVDALWLSPSRGLVLFDMVEGGETEEGEQDRAVRPARPAENRRNAVTETAHR